MHPPIASVEIMKHGKKATVLAIFAVVLWESGVEGKSGAFDAVVKRAGGAELVDRGKQVIKEIWSARPSHSEGEGVSGMEDLRLDHSSRSCDPARSTVTRRVAIVCSIFWMLTSRGTCMLSRTASDDVSSFAWG